MTMMADQRLASLGYDWIEKLADRIETTAIADFSVIPLLDGGRRNLPLLQLAGPSLLIIGKTPEIVPHLLDDEETGSRTYLAAS